MERQVVIAKKCSIRFLNLTGEDHAKSPVALLLEPIIALGIDPLSFGREKRTAIRIGDFADSSRRSVGTEQVTDGGAMPERASR